MERKKTRSLSQKEIINSARRIIIDDGYKNLSMRKIARDLNCQAPTLYYYFKNKTEIVRCLIIEGFNLLLEKYNITYQNYTDPVERLRELLYTYVNFAFDYPAFYYIMYSLPAEEMDMLPENKYHFAKEISLITQAAIKDGIDRKKLPDREIPAAITASWSILHGVILLIQSNQVTSLIEKNILIKSVIDDFIINAFIKHLE